LKIATEEVKAFKNNTKKNRRGYLKEEPAPLWRGGTDVPVMWLSTCQCHKSTRQISAVLQSSSSEGKLVFNRQHIGNIALIKSLYSLSSSLPLWLPCDQFGKS